MARPKGVKDTITTPQQDDVIRKCWEHNKYSHHAAKRVSEITGLTTSVAYRRASQLGLVFSRQQLVWTEPELKIVEDNAHLCLETIQRKLAFVSPPGAKRTRAAIAQQIYSQRFRTNLDGMHHGQLACALGITTDRLHSHRINRKITGNRLESIRQACGYREVVREDQLKWFYKNEDIVRFLFEARGEIDLKRVDQTWFMGLLESHITVFAPTRRDLANEEKERTRLAKKRAREQAPPDGRTQIATEKKRKEEREREVRARKNSTATGVLSDELVARIRNRRNRSRGGASSPPAKIDIGIESKPSGDDPEKTRTETETTSLSGTPSSGVAGATSVVSPSRGDIDEDA